MSQAALEAYLARLYTDPEARACFLADPRNAALDAGLEATDADSLCAMDTVGLQMAAASFAHKRARHRAARKKPFDLLSSWWHR